MHKMVGIAISVVVALAWTSLTGVTEARNQKKDTLSPRVKVVRQMYEKVPPLILEVVEPVEVVKATLFEDGGSIVVELKDAKGKQLAMILDGAIRSKSRWTMFVSYEAYSKKAVLLRGAEEAALYGILLRWKSNKDTEWWTRESVGAMLDHLDRRFTGESEEKK